MATSLAMVRDVTLSVWNKPSECERRGLEFRVCAEGKKLSHGERRGFEFRVCADGNKPNDGC